MDGIFSSILAIGPVGLLFLAFVVFCLVKGGRNKHDNDNNHTSGGSNES